MEQTERLSDPEEIRRLVAEQVETERREYGPHPDQPSSESKTGTGTIPSDEILDCLGRNQDGDAELLARILKRRFVFDHSAGRWFVFTGHHWREDLKGEALQAVGEIVTIYETEYKRQAWLRLKAIRSEDKDAATEHAENMGALLKRIKLLQSLKWKKDVLILSCSGKDTLGITGQEWDKTNMELACANGIVNLNDGTLRPGEPEDYIKTAAPTEWRGLDEPCPTWERFLDEIFGGNTSIDRLRSKTAGLRHHGTCQPSHLYNPLGDWPERERNNLGNPAACLGRLCFENGIRNPA